MEITVEMKKDIIQNELNHVDISIYQHELSMRVGKRVDNKEMVKKAEEALVKLEALILTMLV